jgi:hypothetical protein
LGVQIAKENARQDTLWPKPIMWLPSTDRLYWPMNAGRMPRRLLRRALRGPEGMQPHERGQIAHIAATEDGARAIHEAKKPIPACLASTWRAPKKSQFEPQRHDDLRRRSLRQPGPRRGENVIDNGIKRSRVDQNAAFGAQFVKVEIIDIAADRVFNVPVVLPSDFSAAQRHESGKALLSDNSSECSRF